MATEESLHLMSVGLTTAEERDRFARRALSAIVYNTSDDEARQAAALALRILTIADVEHPAVETMTNDEVIDWLRKVGWLRSDMRVSLEMDLNLWRLRRANRKTFESLPVNPAPEKLVTSSLGQAEQPVEGDLEHPSE